MKQQNKRKLMFSVSLIWKKRKRKEENEMKGNERKEIKGKERRRKKRKERNEKKRKENKGKVKKENVRKRNLKYINCHDTWLKSFRTRETAGKYKNWGHC
jgi:hypothetical protein